MFALAGVMKGWCFLLILCDVLRVGGGMFHQVLSRRHPRQISAQTSSVNIDCMKAADGSSIVANAAEWCRKCIEERNGHGHFEDPCNCRNYLQCDVDQFGKTIAKRRQCGARTLFRRDILTCTYCQDPLACSGTIEPQDRCSAIDTRPAVSLPEVPTNSVHGTGEEKNKINWGECHLAGAGQHDLVDQATCCCFQGLLRCSHVNDLHSFFQKTMPTCQRSTRCDNNCCPATCGAAFFDLETCSCQGVRGAIAIFDFEDTPKPRDIDNQAEFLSKVFFYPADRRLVEPTILRDEIKYGEKAVSFSSFQAGDIEIPRFNNYFWGSQVTISFWYRRTSEAGIELELLSNGNCDKDPTIRFLSTPNGLVCTFCVTGTGNECTHPSDTVQFTFKDIPLSTYIGVVFRYNGRMLRLMVKPGSRPKIEKKKRVTGSIPATIAPLSVGKGLRCINKAGSMSGMGEKQTSNFVGQMDELQIYDRFLTNKEVKKILDGGKNLPKQ